MTLLEFIDRHIWFTFSVLLLAACCVPHFSIRWVHKPDPKKTKEPTP